MAPNVSMERAIVITSRVPKRERATKTDEQIRTEARRMLKFPLGEPEWAQSGPQSDADVGSLFAKLTLQDIPLDQRRDMGCRKLLEELAQRVDSSSDFQVVAFTGACQVAIDRGFISPARSAKIMEPLGEKGSLIQVKRAAAVRFSMVSDLMHHYRVVGLRTYELLIRREKRCLNLVGSFSIHHFEALMAMLNRRDHDIYVPERQFNSTYLRVPNVVHTLFAGICSRLDVELTFKISDWPLSKSQTPDEIDLVALDEAYESTRQMVCTEIVPLTPTLRQGGLEGCGALGLGQGLFGFAEKQASVITMVAQSHGMEITDWAPGNQPPRVFCLHSASYTRAPSGYLGLAILLCNRPVQVKREPRSEEEHTAGGDGRESGKGDGGEPCTSQEGEQEEEGTVTWSPNKVLCFLEQGVRAKDQRNEVFFLLTLVKQQDLPLASRRQSATTLADPIMPHPRHLEHSSTPRLAIGQKTLFDHDDLRALVSAGCQAWE